jgi:hypothetical protein
MKKHLFYTFLWTFGATALVTLLGIAGVLQIPSGILISLVGAFLLELAGAVIYVFRKADFFDDNKIDSQNDKKLLPDTSNRRMIDYYKSAHFYWLGIDLLDAFHNAFKQDGKGSVIRSVSQAFRHFKEAGFSNKGIQDHLQWIVVTLRADKDNWQHHEYRSMMQDHILNVRDKITVLVEHEAGEAFKPFED